MTFSWTPHRFSGGALALDVANSVILRGDPKRRADRFAQPKQLADFADAAGRLSAEPGLSGALAPVATHDLARFLDLRERIDDHFRFRCETGRDDHGRLSALLACLAQVFAAHPEQKGPCPIDLATARSSLALLSASEQERMKICGNCGWLFLDRSRNRSRSWCDMAVCGNRAKARLHYQKTRKERQ